MSINIIHLKGIKLKALLGIRKKERRNKQYIYISCIIQYNLFGELKENIKNTINYKNVLKLVKTFIKNNSFFLIETLAFELSQFLIKHLKLKYILLKIEKLEVLKNIEKIGVIIERNI